MTEKELDQADHIYKHGGDPKPTDYKPEARECAAQIDRATCPASHGEDWAMGLCIECFIAPIASLLERLCGEARREGAREALERAEKVLQWLATDPERRRMYVAYGARALACYVVDAVDAIRALADQPEAEGRKPE